MWSDWDAAWRVHSHGAGGWFNGVCVYACSGDEVLGDMFGKAVMRTLVREKDVGLLSDLAQKFSSRDVSMLLHAGGSLSRRIEARATVLVSTLCAALLWRSRRRVAATRLQSWWRFKRFQWYAKVRYDARNIIRRVAKGCVQSHESWSRGVWSRVPVGDCGCMRA